MSLTLRSTVPAVLLVGGLVVLSGTSGAVAGAMITGKDIKNGTVTTADIKNLSLEASDTSTDFDAFMQRVGGYKAIHKSVVVAGGNGGAVSATCPDGTSILGSAAWWTASNTGPQVQVAPENGYSSKATAYAPNVDSNSDTLHLTLYCGRTTS